ncbi:MAG: hypothetical protein LBQ24_07645 [Candidatus Peribacteria bacterium]|jgi:hypothetical protein|nr:hypothetical protein [Candidatus Peribacteria bacterium]
MKDIESISLEDYEEVKNILYFYTSLVVNSYETDNNKKTNFSKLYNQIEDKEFDFKNEYVVSLNNIYSKLDLNDNNEYGGVYKNLNGLLSNLSQNNEQTSYLTFFLNKTIISGFGLNIDIESILDIFNEYTNISLSYYQKGDETLIRT